MAVEVDCPQHESDCGRARDARRDRWLGDNGWHVVRGPNAPVISGGELELAPI